MCNNVMRKRNKRTIVQIKKVSLYLGRQAAQLLGVKNIRRLGTLETTVNIII